MSERQHHVPTQGAEGAPPTADCLVDWIPKLLRWIRRAGFSQIVAEQAVDHAVRKALPYVTGEKVCLLRHRGAWLRTIAFRFACRLQRKELPHAERDLEKIPVPEQGDAGPQSQALAKAFEAILEQLKERQRRALVCCVMRGLSLKEAAAEMECSVATVRHHLERGQKQFARLVPAPKSRN